MAETDSVQTLNPEVDLVLLTEEKVESLTRRWEAQWRRESRLSLPAVLLLTAGSAGAGASGEGFIQRLSALPVRAWGLLRRDADPEALAAAVRALHAGLAVSEPQILTPLLVPPGSPAASPLASGGGQVPQLTPREIEVLRLLAQGLGNKQIAWELGVSEHTVKFHTSAIYGKLGVANRTEALRRGVELGLLSL